MSNQFAKQSEGRDRVSSALDLLIILLCFVTTHRVYLGDLDFSSERLAVMLVTIASSFLVLAIGGVYRESRSQYLHEEIGRLFICWMVIIFSVSLFAFLSKVAVEVSRLWFGISIGTAFLLSAALRIVVSLMLAAAHKQGLKTSSIVVIGGGHEAQMVLTRLEANPAVGVRVAAIFDSKGVGHSVPESGHSITGNLDDVLPFVEHMRQLGQPIDEVWLALPLEQVQVMRTVIDKLNDSSVDVCIVPDMFAMQLLSGAQMRVADMAVVNVSDIRIAGTAERFKTVFDTVVASIAVTVLLPVMVAIAIAIKLESKGPVLFRQRRYGMNGQEIEVWKFRSMRVDKSEDVDKRVRQATRGDERVTRVGALLRRTSMDELPQFYNVLQGQMSIVGPRPHAVSHNEEYRHQIDGYMMRHKIKPGITGWAQVNGWRGETDTLEKMEKRVQYDLEYIRDWSAWFDIKIMLLTVVRGFSGKNVY
ncbi:MAG: undecaprenyl-phosphate glucose phosphotransferase [Granulosicoccus sp.]